MCCVAGVFFMRCPVGSLLGGRGVYVGVGSIMKECVLGFESYSLEFSLQLYKSMGLGILIWFQICRQGVVGPIQMGRVRNWVLFGSTRVKYPQWLNPWG